MSVTISAVICTHNRLPYLRKALDSLVRQTLDPTRYEILVIDNASTDGTAEAVRDELPRTGNVRYAHEPRLGLSIARNTGHRLARGAYIAYLDDDAVADPRWLEAVVAAFDAEGERIGILGGPVIPIWERPRPDWLPDELLGFLTILDAPRPAGFIGPDQLLVGANLVVARQALEAAGGFPVDLGRRGSQLQSNEELALRTRLEDLGYGVYYDPAVKVQHHVAPERLEKGWFYRRLYWQGRSEAVWWKTTQTPGAVHVARRSARAGFAGLRASAGALAGRMEGSQRSLVFRRDCAASRQLGMLVGLLRPVRR
jgi:glycosyltransferase involved in cell wall biosynthesis